MFKLEDKMNKIAKENPEILLMLCAKKNLRGEIDVIFGHNLDRLSMSELPIVINRLKPLVDDMIEQYEKATNTKWEKNSAIGTANTHKI